MSEVVQNRFIRATVAFTVYVGILYYNTASTLRAAQ